MKEKLLNPVTITLAVVTVALVALSFIGNGKQPEQRVSQEPVGTKHDNQGQEHINSLDTKHETYNSQLPSSGTHYIVPADWGVYSQTVPDEQMIHNLEHGGIAIAYKPDLPKDQLDKLENIARSLTAIDTPSAEKGYKVLMYPRAKNEKPIQLAAWQYTLDLDKVDEGLIKTFYRQRLNKAPESNAQ